MAGKGKPFKAGNPGGPGRPALPPDVKHARAATKATFTKLLNDLVNLTEPELEALESNAGASMLTKVAAKLILKTRETGDHMRFDTLMNRMIGKVKDESELTVKPGVKVIELGPLGKKIELGKEEA